MWGRLAGWGRVIVAPLVSGATYRRGVYLLLGGVLLLPYVLLATAFAQLFRADNPLALALLLLAVTVVIAGAPAFLSATRTLETVAARALLEVELPDPVADRPRLETRLRSALWFALHLASGGVVGFVLLVALPMALAFIAARFGIGAEALAELRLGPLDGLDIGWWSLLGLGMLLGVVYAVAGLGRLATTMAPVLLGPSPAERIAALEAAADQLIERNRLARELHDSIGHALTVTTLQAAAAGEVVDSDPEFVRRALRAVEETGRAAMTELDHMLGVLRDGDRAAGPASPLVARTLGDLDRLVAEVRRTGGRIDVSVTGPVGELPAVVSREGYRIVQEGVTNATRHAPGQPVTVRVAVSEGVLTVEVTNPAGEARPRPAGSGGGSGGSGGGRGLVGMRERAALLGGELSVDQAGGQAGGQWRVMVRLPLAGRRVR